MSDANTPSPWHSGEKQLQARIGVAEQMEVFGRKVIRDHLPEQHRAFYQQLPFILMGTVSPEGLPWAGILAGEPGFAHSPTAQTLRLETHLDANDPCSSGLAAGRAIGLLGIELHSRRRNRLNGRLVRREHDHLEIAVEQSFGNCPQYIQLRQLQAAKAEPREALPVERANQLSTADQAMISRADTFFVASYIEQANGQLAVDVSHRGGQAGFVRVEGNRLSIPDFAGNLHFNTLGNLLLNPRAGLLFIDFSTGDLLQLSGTTELVLEGQEVQAFQGAERLWHVQVEHVVRRPAALSLRWYFADYSPNSLMTGSWAEAQARLAAMDLQQQWRPWRVVRIIEESPSVRSFYLEPSDGAGMPSFIAGQHMALRINITGQPRPLIRTYSLSSAPSDRFMRISVKREGLASTYLHEHLQVGSLLEGRAPQGHLRLDNEQRRPLVLLAAGIGITPLLSMLRETLYQNRRLRRHRTIWLIQAARTTSELIFREELADLLQPGDTSLHMLRVLSQPEATARQQQDYDLAGHVDVALLKAWLPWDDYDFYLCGPGTFTQSLYDGLRELNISDQRIHAESFGPASLRRSGDALNSAPTLPPATVAVPVLFQRSGKEARWTPGSGSLLELAESRGLSPEFSCRSGNCGACKAAVLSGAVTYQHQPPEQPADGHALLCCAVPAATAAGSPPPGTRPLGRRLNLRCFNPLASERLYMTENTRPPYPPFDLASATQKVRLAEDGWNTRDPDRVALAYTADSRWRNRSEFPQGREQIRAFLTRKWAREHEYRLIKELWAFQDNRIAVRFAYEWHDDSGQWFRSYGNENWEFDAQGLMQTRHASINDLPIPASERLFHWPQGRRPDDHPGLSELGL